MRAIPWVLLATVTALSAWLWTRGPDPGPPPEPPAARADILPLRRCQARLEGAEAVLDRCRRTRAAPAQKPAAADVDECVQHPAVAALIDTLVEEELQRRVETAAAERTETRAAMQSAAADFLRLDLELSAEQASWVEEYVCALRDQRAQLWRELEESKVERGQAWERLARERNEAIADLKTFLGEEHYQRLREVGGLGLIADAAGCQ